jgi:hypothetical protein
MVAKLNKPALKRAAPKSKAPPDAKPEVSENARAASYGLRGTSTPGVWCNSHGDYTDSSGVLLNFKALTTRHHEYETRVLGKAAETPAEVMKLVAMDRALPLGLRLDAAKAAAPYYDRRKPQAIDGGEDPNNPKEGLPIKMQNLRGLSSEELLNLSKLLEKAT